MDTSWRDSVSSWKKRKVKVWKRLKTVATHRVRVVATGEIETYKLPVFRTNDSGERCHIKPYSVRVVPGWSPTPINLEIIQRLRLVPCDQGTPKNPKLDTSRVKRQRDELDSARAQFFVHCAKIMARDADPMMTISEGISGKHLPSRKMVVRLPDGEKLQSGARKRRLVVSVDGMRTVGQHWRNRPVPKDAESAKSQLEDVLATYSSDTATDRLLRRLIKHGGIRSQYGLADCSRAIGRSEGWIVRRLADLREQLKAKAKA